MRSNQEVFFAFIPRYVMSADRVAGRACGGVRTLRAERLQVWRLNPPDIRVVGPANSRLVLPAVAPPSFGLGL